MLNDTYVPGHGPLSPKIVIVGEAPSYDEIETGKCFVGPAGRELNAMLKEAGINREACWVTNVSKYFVPLNPPGKNISFQKRAFQAGVNLTEQIDHLRNELGQLKPNIVIALGATALWALTGKTKIQSWRGSIMLGMGLKTMPTYHPAHFLYHSGGEFAGYWNRKVSIFDLKRAKEQSEYPEIRRPNRLLAVAKSSAQLEDFIKRHHGYNELAVDIEAGGTCIPICIGLSFRRQEGLTVPLWNINDISSIPDSDLASCWYLLARVLHDNLIIGQNFGYDRDKIKRLGFITPKFHSDTMLKAFAVNPELPKNLAFLTSLYTEEPYYKDEGMYEGTYSDLMMGCARDACVTKEIDEVLSEQLISEGMEPYFNNFLMKLHDLYAEIEQEGILTDNNIRAELIEKYVRWDEKIRYRLFELCGEHINTNSSKQVEELLYSTWGIPRRKGTGEEVLTGLLNGPVKDPRKREGIELILEDRQVKKTLGTYLLTPNDFDGRMRTSFFLCLDTGRSSTNQQAPPIRPSYEFRDEHNKKKAKALGCAFQTLTKHGDIGPEIRRMYVADPGEIFLQLDSSQAEARVIFLLAEDYDALDLIDTCDYHALTASWFFGGSEQDHSKKVLGYESKIRFAGKTLRHAGHLGASKGRAATELNTQARKYKINFQISEQVADKALKIFHAKQPKIRGVFQKGVIDCLQRTRKLTAPVPTGIDAPLGGTRIFFERWGDELFRQGFSYLPQRTVTENTKAAALRIKKRASWIRILMESHDALLLSVPISRRLEAALIGREEMTRPIDFSRCSLKRGELIIPCDVEEGYDYFKFDKFKFDMVNV